MPASGGLRFVAARMSDASAIAGLHVDSWRRHYRDAYSDAFLDGDVDSYLLTVWTERMSTPNPRDRTILAEFDGAIVGFAHASLGDHPTWGALLDNLHVAYGLKRQGIGTRLIALTAQAVVHSSPASGLYLWVLEQNSAARAFYEAQGGSCVERRRVRPPGDNRANLNGKPVALRYAWPDASKLADRFPAAPLVRADGRGGRGVPESPAAGIAGAACGEAPVSVGQGRGPADDRTQAMRFHDALQECWLLSSGSRDGARPGAPVALPVCRLRDGL